MTHVARSSKLWMLSRAALVGICLSLAAMSVTAQTTRKTAAGGEEDPLFLEYRGIQIGWLADEVRKKLGVPRDKSDEQDL